MPKLDRLGRPQRDPHQLFSHIEGINWLAEHMPVVQVPGAAWALDADDAGEQVAVVACPCAHDHVVALLEAPAPCGSEGCECPRHYAFTGRDVWCFNSPVVLAAT